jgi:prolipoprotein diacylglyceryl transferase
MNVLEMALTINPIAFEIGGLQVRWYGIIIAFGIYLATTLADREATRKGYRKDFIIDLVFWAVPLGFVGARLYYILFEWQYYLANPAEIIQIWHGGIAIYGGVIAGAATVYWFAKKEKVSFALLLDILAPVVLLAQSIGRWGNFTNQEAHGEVTTRAFLEGLHLPNFIIEQMQINGAYYQPTFLYESLWSFVGVLILFYLRRRKGVKVGEIAAGYLIWYSFGRFFIEGMRTDSLWMFNVIRISQLVSIVLFLLGIGLIIVRRRRVPAVPDYVSIDNPQSPILFGKV